MRLLVKLIKAYPWRTAIALLAILLAGIADGFSISALLPLLNIAIGSSSGGAQIPPEPGDAGGQLEAFIIEGLSVVGL